MSGPLHKDDQVMLTVQVRGAEGLTPVAELAEILRDSIAARGVKIQPGKYLVTIKRTSNVGR